MKGLSKKHLIILLIGIVLSVFFTPLYMYYSHDVGALKDHYPHIKTKSFEEPDYVLSKDKPEYWVSMSEISEYGKWAIVLSEDWAFYQHEGLDLQQIRIAFQEMLEGYRSRGASTITQQMVKNIFLTEKRSLWRKLHEIILSLRTEKELAKDKILEIYLNSIEYGPGIYGIRAASFHYFNKHPSQLLPREGAFLAMLLPSPKKYYVSFKRRKLSDFAKLRVREILTKMRMAKVISLEHYEQELQTTFFWEESF